MAYDGRLKFDTSINGEGFNSGIQKITKSAKLALASIAAAFSAKELIQAVVRFGSEAETSMATVSTLVEGTAAECRAALGNISADILETSSATGQAASSLAEAAYQALSASVPVEKTGKFVDAAAKLATGGFTSTASAVDLMTTAINAYGLDAADAQKISDSFIAAQNKGKTTVNEIAASLGRVAPSAAAFSVSLYDTEAALAQMTKGGIATAESATYLKGMLNELGKDSSAVSRILTEQTGQSFTGLMESGHSLGEVLDLLYGSVDRDATAFANLWSSQEAGTGALSIVNQGTKDYAATLDAITNSAGATESAYGKMMDTFDGKSKVFEAGAKNVAIAAYDLIETPLKSAADKGIEVVQKLAKYIQQNGDKIVKTGKTLLTVITSVVAALVAFKAALALTKAVSAVVTTVSTATKIFKLFAAGTTAAAVVQKSACVSGKALGTVMAFASGKIKLAAAAQALFNGTLLANHVVLVVAAVAALTAGIIALVKVTKDSTSATQEELEAFREKHEATLQLVDSQKELTDACNERVEGDLAQIQQAQALADKLFGLADANGFVAEENRSLAIFIINELNGAYGLNIQMIDGVIQKRDEEMKSIDDLLQKKQAEIYLSALEEQYTDAIKNRAAAVAQADSERTASLQADQEYAAAKSAHADELKLLEDARLNDILLYNDLLQFYTQQGWLGELEELRLAAEEKKAMYDESQTVVDGYYAAIQAYQDGSIAAQEEDLARLREIHDQQNGVVSSASTVVTQSAAEQTQALGQAYADRLIALDYYSQEYLAGNKNISAEQIADLTAQAEEARIAAEAVGVSIVDGQIEGLDGKKIDLTNTLQSLCDTSVELCKSSKPEFQSAGENMGQGIADGIIIKSSAVSEAARQAVRDAIAAAKAEAEINSPSKKMIKLGEGLGEGGELGIRKKIPDVVAASQDYTAAAIKTVASGFRSAVAESQVSVARATSVTSRPTPNDPGVEPTPATVDARQYITFEQPMQAPDEIARAVRGANKFGLAGARS